MKRVPGGGSLREVDIALDGVSGEESARGLERLKKALGRKTGLMGADLDLAAGVLRLRYDPRYVSLVRVQDLARRLEPALARRFERCTLCVLGLRSAGVSPRRLERHLEAAPGVERALVCPAAGTVSVEFDSDCCSGRRIEEHLAEAGFEVGHPPHNRAALRATHDRDARNRFRMAALSASCAVLAAAGWIGERTGALPHGVSLAFYVGSFLAGGLDATRRALNELRGGGLNVDLLMVVAALGAASVGCWPEGAALLFLFSLSNALEQYILGRTRRAIEALMDLTPEEAVAVRGGREVRVPVGELAVGDLIRVRPGERIAADGLIRVGRTAVDQSAMTGESIPVERQVGDPVFAATLNGQGAIDVEVTRVAGDTALARIVRLVEEAQSEKAPSQRFTEWFGARYTLAVIGLAVATFVVPVAFFGVPAGAAFYRAMTVLVVASPCAVVISIPAAILSAIAGAARGGILFKGGMHLEESARLRAVAFDKTGTLTVGKPRVVDLRAAEGVLVEEMLQLAASAESLSEHPLARAVIEAAEERRIALLPASDLEALVGRGLRAKVGGRWVSVGKAEICVADRAVFPALAAEAAALVAAGDTVIHVGDERGVIGVVAIADTLRPCAGTVVSELRALGIEHVIMLTGDQRGVASAIAAGLGVEYEAELLPEDKLRVIHRLREQYGSVAMVGDGINDAPALAAATLGVSLGGGGTDVALETADVVLMANDLELLPRAISLARRAQVVIRQNLLFAFGMMALLLGFTFFGHLPLPLAVLGHEGSTVLVILNGVRLFRKPTTA